jgi:hypothetical protein
MSHFLFEEGTWAGKGELTFSAGQEVIEFATTWDISSVGEQQFRAVQAVLIDGQDPMTNVFTVTRQPSGDFQLFLENKSLGMFSGQGISDDKQLAWEFTHYGALEGMEVYERSAKKEYKFRAEYLGGDGVYTSIRGNIAKAEQKKGKRKRSKEPQLPESE